MMRVFHRTGQALLAVALTLNLLAAPIAWAATPGPQGTTGWLTQLWDLVARWVAPVESGPTADPHGVEATSDSETKTTEPWAEPVPLDPATTDTSNDDSDRGPAADPHG